MQEDTETEKAALSLSGLKRWLQSKPTRLVDGSLRALTLILTHFERRFFEKAN